jgi:hypothetical protein
MKAEREVYQPALKIEPVQRKPNVIAEVETAILAGANTRERLQRETKLPYDDIGLALCYLIYDTGKVKIRRIGQRRELIAA